MKSALRLLVFTLILVLVGEGFAQVPAAKPETVDVSPDRLSRIRTVLQKEVDADRMPGAVVTIARRGQLIYSEAIGFQDKAAGKPTRETAKRQMTIQDLFRHTAGFAYGQFSNVPEIKAAYAEAKLYQPGIP